jgi:hypothetical protein
MLKTKLSIAITLIAVLSLLLVPAVYAADEKTTTGSFTAQGVDPTVDAIEIYATEACDGSPVDAMDPQQDYWVKVTVTAKNKLSQLQSVQATLFYDATGTDTAPTTPDTHTCAIFTWTASTDAFTFDAGTTTTWDSDPAKCHRPASLSDTTGDWRFHFVPGKVAEENTVGHWAAQGLATRNPSSTGELYVRNKDMNWFGEVTVSGVVDWGTVQLGLAYDDDPPNPQVVAHVIYIANGDYSQNIKSTDWENAGATETVTLNESGTPGAEGEFALKANAGSDLGDAQVVQKAIFTAIGSGSMTEEGGDDVTDNNLWLSLSAAGITAEQYSGDIYYQIDVPIP